MIEQNHETESAFNLYGLGQLYEKGLGGPVDMQAAAGWYRAAIRKGYPCHANLLCLIVNEGIDLLSKREIFQCLLALHRSPAAEDQSIYQEFRDLLLTLGRSPLADERILCEEFREWLPLDLRRLIFSPLPPTWHEANRASRKKPGRHRKTEA